jgi:hypothetical protein
MSTLKTTPKMTRNPLTHQRHRREVGLQITLPLTLGGALLLAFSVLAIVALSSEAQSQWADVALIWLIVPLLFVAFLILVIVAGLAYLVIMLIEVLPPYSQQMQDFMALVATKVGEVCDKSVEPVLRLQSLSASRRALQRNLKRE